MSSFLAHYFGFLFLVSTISDHHLYRQFRISWASMNDNRCIQQDTPTGQNADEKLFYTSDQKLSRFVAWLSTFLAVVLLVCPITILYVVDSDKLKLGLIAIFTVLFGGSVGLLSNAKRAEIFASTAAYVLSIPSSMPLVFDSGIFVLTNVV